VPSKGGKFDVTLQAPLFTEGVSSVTLPWPVPAIELHTPFVDDLLIQTDAGHQCMAQRSLELLPCKRQLRPLSARCQEEMLVLQSAAKMIALSLSKKGERLTLQP